MHKEDVKREKISKYTHISIIILGTIFVMLSIFHTNMWFDESYSVAIAKYSFADIWKIGSNDVHPVLYYLGLHLLNLIFGNNLIIYRIFSAIPIILLGIVGYTHIRKDFGEKVGFLFSFFTFFLPISCVYSGEIRMYTWAMLFVSMMAIYAYRIYKEVSCASSVNNMEQSNAKDRYTTKNGQIKNWILFAIFSLAACYTHYYGLATAGIINLILFIYLTVKVVKVCKLNKTYKRNQSTNADKKEDCRFSNSLLIKNLKWFIIQAIIEVLVYLPWLIYVVSQLGRVSKGFWIPGPTAKTFLQIFIFQFTGDLDNLLLEPQITISFGVILLAYVIYAMIRATSSNKAGLLAITIYFIVGFAMYLVSVIKVPILFARYFLNLTGLFIFFISFFIAKGGKKPLTCIICIITVIMAGVINFQMIKINYDEKNTEPLAYIQSDLQESDMLLWENNSQGFAISTVVDKQPKCFYDKLYWNQEAAYAAYGKDMTTIKKIEELKEYEGRIWVIGAGNYDVYNELVEKYAGKINLIKQKEFEVPYHELKYTATLVQKDI